MDLSSPVRGHRIADNNNVIRRRSVAASGDNSNTQFAVLGLWVARKHGVKVDEALQKTNDYFRQSIDRNRGGWGYQAYGASTPAMTCAGLIALATHFGTSALRAGTVDDLRGGGRRAAAKVPVAKGNALKDPVVQRALEYLEGTMARVAASKTSIGCGRWSASV
jgi:hypothetical protein